MTSTATEAIGRAAAAATPTPAAVLLATADTAEPPTRSPVPPTTVEAAADEPPVTLAGSTIVPVNISRATPTTRAITSSAAIGANGRLNTSLAGTDSCGPRPQLGRDQRQPVPGPGVHQAGHRDDRERLPGRQVRDHRPAAVSATKLPSSQATARSGGSRRHQAWTVPPWLSATTMPNMIGNAARNGHENGSTATPNASVAAGVSSSQASAVSAAQDANERLSRGAGQLARPGQPEQRHVQRRPDDQHHRDQPGEPEPGLAVGEQPAQVVVGGERRHGGDLRRDRPGGRREEREQATLGHGAADRDEDQPSVPKEPLGGKFRAHIVIRVRMVQVPIRANRLRCGRIPEME